MAEEKIIQIVDKKKAAQIEEENHKLRGLYTSILFYFVFDHNQFFFIFGRIFASRIFANRIFAPKYVVFTD